MIVTDDAFDGWANWETWVINLWIANDQKLYEYFEEITRAEVSQNKASATSKSNLSATLHKQFDEWMPEVGGPYLDLLNGAMRKINWHEIARHLVEQVEEEENYNRQAN